MRCRQRLLLAMAIGVAGILSEPRKERTCRTGALLVRCGDR